MKTFFEKYPLEENVIAAGVSGGADSLALVLRLKEWADENDKKVVALTVNHHLRPESTSEALYVAQLMNKFGIEHHILSWEGEKPQTGIEEAAREARYALLKSWCDEHKVGVLATGHHLRDQAETFFMRLQRGSGLDGLCGIRPVSKRDGLILMRPLLSIMPEDLKKYLYNRQIEWVEDPSNQCDDFLRVRVRKFMPVLQENLGITPQRMVETMKVLQSTLDYVQYRVNQYIKNHVRNWDSAGISFSEKNLPELHEELLFRVLGTLLYQQGNAKYKAEAAELHRLMMRLKEDDFVSCTLGGCEIIKKYGQIWIVPELKIKNKPSKKDWEDFCNLHPKYKKLKIPYKLRLSLLKLNPIYK